MMRCAWFGVLAAFGVMLGAGCGGTASLDAFKDRALVVDFDSGGQGRGALHVLLSKKSLFSTCAGLSPDVQMTVNGALSGPPEPGGCGASSQSSPGFTFEMDVNDTPQSAIIAISDDTHRMEVEVADLFANYRIRPMKEGFDPNVQLGNAGVNPVARGEVLSFERIPAVRDVSLEASLQQEHLDSNGKRSWTIFDLESAQSGAQLQVTIPADASSGLGSLGMMTTDHPAVTRCEGVDSCESEIMLLLGTDVTVTP